MADTCSDKGRGSAPLSCDVVMSRVATVWQRQGHVTRVVRSCDLLSRSCDRCRQEAEGEGHCTPPSKKHE